MQRLTILTKRYCRALLRTKREYSSGTSLKSTAVDVVPSRLSVGLRFGSFKYDRSRQQIPKKHSQTYKNIGAYKYDAFGFNSSDIKEISITEDIDDFTIQLNFENDRGKDFHNDNIFITIDSRTYYGYYNHITGKVRPAEYTGGLITNDIRVYSAGNARYPLTVVKDWIVACSLLLISIPIIMQLAVMLAFVIIFLITAFVYLFMCVILTLIGSILTLVGISVRILDSLFGRY